MESPAATLIELPDGALPHDAEAPGGAPESKSVCSVVIAPDRRGLATGCNDHLVRSLHPDTPAPCRASTVARHMVQWHQGTRLADVLQQRHVTWVCWAACTPVGRKMPRCCSCVH
jgi:hypothetical protein